MKIREEKQIVAVSREGRQQQIIENIAELEQQHRDGVMETPAYLIKKKALVRLL